MQHLLLMVSLANSVLARLNEERNQGQGKESLTNIGIFIIAIPCSLLLCCCYLDWKEKKQNSEGEHSPFANCGISGGTK